MGDETDALIDEVTVDAYGDSEQFWVFRQAFEDGARFPFRARVIGVDVAVTSVDFEGDDRRGLVAVCQRERQSHTVSLLDVTPTDGVDRETCRLLDAYRRWSGAAPLPPTGRRPSTKWRYEPFAASVDIGTGAPLGLTARGDWDPTTEYWGESDEVPHPLLIDIVGTGARPSFEMEQVLPGVDDDDWDSDSIVEATDLHHAGLHRHAIRVLEGLLAIDDRCIDAWSHLGLIAFHTRGPGPAREPFEIGVALGEAALPVGFDGVLPRGYIDNRPFLRSLHGLALCAWRQRRWDEAGTMFTARVWLDPSASLDALVCLDQVRARQRWTRK